MICRYADLCLSPNLSGDRIEPIELTILSHCPDEASGDDRGPTPDAGVPQQLEPRRGVTGLHGHDAAKARQVDSHSADSTAAVDVVSTHRSDLGLLAADASQVRTVDQVNDAAFPGHDNLAAG